MAVNLGNLGGIYRESGPETLRAIELIVDELKKVRGVTTSHSSRGSNTLVHSALVGLDYASAGHTGFASTTSIAASLALKADKAITLTAGDGLTGGGDLSANRSFAVGAGTGITVAADTVGISTTYDATLVHTTGNESIASGVKTFAVAPVFNGGIDLGTSGRFDSAVATGGGDVTGANQFLFKPTVGLTSSYDRSIFHVQDPAGNSILNIYSNGIVAFGEGAYGPGSGADWIMSGPAICDRAVLANFAPNYITSTTGVTMGGLTTAIVGGRFGVIPGSGITSIAAAVGGLFEVSVAASSGATPVADTVAALFRFHYVPSVSNADRTFLRTYGLWVRTATGGKGAGNYTDTYGAKIDELWNSSPAMNFTITNNYGLWIGENTRATGINASIWVDGGGKLMFRESTAYIASSATTLLDLYAGTRVVLHAPLDMSSVNLITDAASGTTIGTAATQKLGFFGVTPTIVQPANTVAINDVLVNLGLRASGGVSNFTTNLDISTKNIVTDTSTGTQIGTAAAQKLSLWGVTPVIQPAAALQAAVVNNTLGFQDGTLVDVTTLTLADPAKCNDNFTDLYALVDAMRTALVAAGIMKGAA